MPRLPALLPPLALVATALAVPVDAAGMTHVHIQGFAFRPGSVTIAVGDTVQWDNHDGAPHTATALDGSWDSGVLGQGDAFSHAFAGAGTIDYRCDIHGFIGTVVVLEPGTPPDLVVADLAAVDDGPVAMNVSLTLRNVGGGPAPASVADVRYEGAVGAGLVGRLDVPALAPGASYEGFLTWSTLGRAGEFTLTGRADADDDVDEADEANNEADLAVAVLVPFVPGVSPLP